MALRVRDREAESSQPQTEDTANVVDDPAGKAEEA